MVSAYLVMKISFSSFVLYLNKANVGQEKKVSHIKTRQ